jgi:hypothetical protein
VLPYPYLYVLSTDTLPPGTTGHFAVNLGKQWHITALATDSSARIRVYASEAQRLADANRPIGTDPKGDHGLLCEVVTYADALGQGLLALELSPWAWGETLENAAYVAVTNTGDQTKAITLTLTTQKTES